MTYFLSKDPPSWQIEANVCSGGWLKLAFAMEYWPHNASTITCFCDQLQEGTAPVVPWYPPNSAWHLTCSFLPLSLSACCFHVLLANRLYGWVKTVTLLITLGFMTQGPHYFGEHGFYLCQLLKCRSVLGHCSPTSAVSLDLNLCNVGLSSFLLPFQWLEDGPTVGTLLMSAIGPHPSLVA